MLTLPLVIILFLIQLFKHKKWTGLLQAHGYILQLLKGLSSISSEKQYLQIFLPPKRA